MALNKSLSDFNSDIILQIFSYFSARDSGITSQCCKRFLYLLESLQKEFLEPELIACSSYSLSERLRLQSEKSATATTTDTATTEEEHEDRIKRSRTRSQSKVSSRQVLQQGLSEMQSPPNVAFCFYSTSSARADFLENVEKLLPAKNVAVVSTMSSSGIQANIFKSLSEGTSETKGEDMYVECKSDFSCMMGSFPNAHFVPFCSFSSLDSNMMRVGGTMKTEDDEEKNFGTELLFDSLHKAYDKKCKETDEKVEDESTFWKVFVVHVCGAGGHNAEDFLQQVQERYPQATIVGGVCDEGDVRLHRTLYESSFREQMNSRPMNQLKQIISNEFGKRALYGMVEKRDLVTFLLEKMLGSGGTNDSSNMCNIRDGIYGLAIGGSVPMRSIVSRGLRSSSSREVSPSDSKWSVDKVSFIKPTYSSYPYAGPASMLKPVHVIESVRNNKTGRTLTTRQFLIEGTPSGHIPPYIGVKKLEEDDVDDDGFQLHMLNESNFIGGNLTIMSDGGPNCEFDIRPNSLIDLFELDGEACNEDMENTLLRLKDQLKNEKLLGSIMYSCNGRGPVSSLLKEEMADASRFAKHFPSLPCLGFYAGGEIGPMATFGNKDVFRKGKAALQGFTAVFAVFVVPKKGPVSYDLDDGEESVQKYILKRF